MAFSSRRRIITSVMAASLAVTVYSQDVTKESAVRSLRENSSLQELQKTENEFKLFSAQAQTRINNYIIANNLPDSLAKKLYDVMPDGTPVFMETDNTNSAFTTKTSAIQPGGATGFNLTGEDELIGIWDGGHVRETHEIFTGRASLGDNSYDTSNHATHVAGTLIGNSYANGGTAKGMAPNARLIAHNWFSDFYEASKAVREKNLLISNHSYGMGIDRVSKSALGKYNFYSRGVDDLHANSPYYLQVWSAGNSGVTSDRMYPNRGGYDILNNHKVAKNNVVVAAVHGLSSHDGPEVIKMASFSSWGPTDDGRIKPDISAKGVNVLSAGFKANNDYFTMNGTSMASPNVAGSLLLLQEYSRKNFSSYLRSSTIRGLALHTADEAGNAPGPDYSFGWGLLNMEKAANTLKNIGVSSAVDERVLDDGEVYSFKVRKTSADEALKVSICWTDPAGEINTNGEDDRTPTLVNDLDLRVYDETGTHYPWKLDPAAPSAPATKGDNLVDNIEIVEVESGVDGQVFTVEVSNKNSLAGNGQNFSLIVTGGKHVEGLCNLTQWDNNTPYIKGTEVEHNGEFYKARHWNLNEVPSKANLWGAWEFVKDCNTGTADAPIVNLSTSAVNGEINGLLPITFDASVVSELGLKNVSMRVKSFGKTEYFTPTEGDTYGFTFTPENYGMHSFEFVAVDQFGHKGSQSVNVFVYEATSTPSVALTSHKNSDVVYNEVPFTLKLNAAATIGRDRDVYLSFPEFLQIDRVKLNAENAPAFTYEVTVPAGTPVSDIPVLAEIVEADGTVSATQTVTLKSGSTVKPVVKVLSSTDTLFTTLTPALIKASANDADGSVSKVYLEYTDITGNTATEEMTKVGDNYQVPYTPFYMNGKFKLNVYAVDNVGAAGEKQEILARVSSAETNNAPFVEILLPTPSYVMYGNSTYDRTAVRFSTKTEIEDGPEYIVRSEVYLNGNKVFERDYYKSMSSKGNMAIITPAPGVNDVEVRTLDERGVWGSASTSFQFILR